MTVPLRSLRITAEMAADGYARGAKQVADSNRIVVSSYAGLNQAWAQLDANMTRLPAGMARLSRAFLPGYAEAAKFHKELQSLDRTLGEGMSMDRGVAVIGEIERAFGRSADAAELARRGYAAAAQAAQLSRNQNVSQFAWNTGLGVRESSGLTAADFPGLAGLAEEQERMRAGAARLLAELNPLQAALDRHNAELAEYAAMLKAGYLSQDQFAAAQSRSAATFAQQAEWIRRAGQSTRLSRFEVANLGFQLSDVGVMLASGQSPFLLIMQQGMQIADILGPHGLRGGLKELGAAMVRYLTNPVNLAVIGFAALAAGAVWAYSRMTSGAKESSEQIQKNQSMVTQLRENYRALGLDVSKALPDTNNLTFKVGFRLEVDRERVQNEIENIWNQVRPLRPYEREGLGGAMRVFNRSEYKPFVDVIEEMSKSTKGGVLDFEDLERRIIAVANATPEAKNAMLGLVDGLKSVSERAEEAALALDLARGKGDLFSQSFIDVLGDLDKLKSLRSFAPSTLSPREQLNESFNAAKILAENPEQLADATRAYGDAVAYLDAQTAKLAATQRNEIDALYAITPAQKAAAAAEAERISMMGAGIDATEASMRISHAYAMAMAQATIEITRATQAQQLEMQAINAKSPAEKASLAAKREALNIYGDLTRANMNDVRVLQASAIAYAQATKAISDQNRERIRAANDNIAQKRLEVELVGASAFERSLETENLRTYLDLLKQAEANGLSFDTAQYELLKKKNAEAARLTEQLAFQKLMFEARRDGEYMSMSGPDAAIARKLDSAGLSRDSDDYQQAWLALEELDRKARSLPMGLKSGFEAAFMDIANLAEPAESLITNMFSGFEDAWVNFAKTGKFEFSSMIDGMIGDLARLAYRMAMMQILNYLIPGGFNLGGSGGGVNVLGYANGGAFTNSIVSKPTMFAYGGAMGKLGVMGEAGAEAVMPLTRTSNGKLGVAAVGGGTSGPMKFSVTYIGQQQPQIENVERRGDELVVTMREIARDEAMRVVPGIVEQGYGMRRQMVARP